MKGAKKCPFCGSKEITCFNYPYRKAGLRGCFVTCKACGATSGKHETVEDALKAWNERTNENE